MTDPTRALPAIRDARGRRWLLPIIANPVLHPAGHDDDPTELRLLEASAGPLVVEDFQVVDG